MSWQADVMGILTFCKHCSITRGVITTAMDSSVLDAHAKPPPIIRDIYKKYQKFECTALDAELDDLDRKTQHGGTSIAALPQDLREILLGFLESSPTDSCSANDFDSAPDLPLVYEVAAVPGKQGRIFFSLICILSMVGLYIYPSLLPSNVQMSLLDKLLHRDLKNPGHKTNIHLHHDVPYPPHGSSYFSTSARTLAFQPKDSTVHKSFTTINFLNRKLRWMTLGGQYDWTNKVYPAGPPPSFPPDIKDLIEGIFPMKAEAAIVNLYSPGDTLSLHRDVSEECDRPLVSISLGCDGIFIAGLEGGDEDGKPRVAVMRLRSGDAVLMSGESRYAWHGVPRILGGTCPEWMRCWPALHGEDAKGGQFAGWEGWMASKRVNLNVRQMFD